MTEPKITDFKAWANLIRKGVTRALGAEHRDPNLHVELTIYGALRLDCYRYYRRLKRARDLETLQEYLDERDPGRWHRHPGDGIDWTLRLLETRREKPLLTAPRRGRMANELRLADKYGIHSQWLLPFLYEAGNERLVRGLLGAQTKPNWVAKYVKPPRQRPIKVPAREKNAGTDRQI